MLRNLFVIGVGPLGADEYRRFNQLGLITFNGPSIMSGFSQAKNLEPKFIEHIKDILFNNYSSYDYFEYSRFSNGYPNWSKKESVGKIKKQIKNDG